MFKWIYLKTDFKKLYREPIMALLFAVPVIIPIAFKLLVTYLVPFVNNYVYFDITPYLPYVLSLALILNPSMLGAVMGFMMLDDKDARIVEIISVTPLGRSGYMFLRLFFVFVGVFFYTIYTYLILGFVYIPLINLSLVGILLSLYGSLTGMILFTIASDKVKGLTYTKGLSAIVLFALSDLLTVPWVVNFSKIFPTYWITKIIMNPTNYLFMFNAAIVHIIWFGACYLWFIHITHK